MPGNLKTLDTFETLLNGIVKVTIRLNIARKYDHLFSCARNSRLLQETRATLKLPRLLDRSFPSIFAPAIVTRTGSTLSFI